MRWGMILGLILATPVLADEKAMESCVLEYEQYMQTQTPHKQVHKGDRNLKAISMGYLPTLQTIYPTLSRTEILRCMMQGAKKRNVKIMDDKNLQTVKEREPTS